MRLTDLSILNWNVSLTWVAGNAHPGFYFQTRASISCSFQCHHESSNVLEEEKKQLECIFSKRRTQTTSLLLPKALEEPASIQLCNSWLEVLLKRKYEYYLTQSCVSVYSRLQTSKFSLTSLIDVTAYKTASFLWHFPSSSIICWRIR